jgi:hypothetical protein
MTNQLARILAMMGSSHDGEVLNAARLAERTRRKMGKSWDELLADRNIGDASAHHLAATLRTRLDKMRASFDQAMKGQRALEGLLALANQRADAAEERCKILQDCITKIQEIRAPEETIAAPVVNPWPRGSVPQHP